MSSSTSRVTGLASGFDTQSIVESLMALEKVPMTKLEVKKQTEDLKLQAYQAVNTYLLKFKTSMNNLASKKLWNSKAAFSTNEKVLTATANEYAVNGSYSFKVAQLATATQYMSKGFASKTDPLVKQDEKDKPYKLGSINLASGKTRVDNSAELESLNGGKGVFRGSIRVTDASGTTSTIDLSSCTTLDDVVRTLNESNGAQISAYLKEGRLMIEDATGTTNAGAKMKITNVGTGTTATDLGIVGEARMNSDGKVLMEGRNVYIMGNNTALSDLNDGLGVEEGYLTLTVSNSGGSTWDFGIDTEGCTTVGDVVKKLNAQIDLARSNPAGSVHPTGYLPVECLDGLRFGVSEDGTSFCLTGTQKGLSYRFGAESTDGKIGQGTPAPGLGLESGVTYTSSGDGETIQYKRVLGGSNSPMLKNLSGARGEGVGTDSDNSNNWIPVPFNQNTKLSALNGGKGLDISSIFHINIYEGGKDNDPTGTLVTDILSQQEVQDIINQDGTVEDLINKFNEKLRAYTASGKKGAAALEGMQVGWTVNGGQTVLEWKGAHQGNQYEVLGAVAFAVGLNRTKAKTGMLGGADPEALDLAKELQDGDRLISGNDYLDRKDDKGKYVATMNELVNLSGVPKDVDKFYQTDDQGNIIYDTDGVTKLFDEDKWKEAAKKVLSGDKSGTWTASELADLKSLEDIYKDKTFTINYNNGLQSSDPGYQGYDVTVNWNDVWAKVKDSNGNPVGWSGAGDAGVEAFLAAANEAISEAFTAQIPAGIVVHPPKFGFNSTGDGFGWSGIDYTKHFEATDLGFLGLDRDTRTLDPAKQPYFGIISDPVSVVPPTPMIPGFTRIETITDANASAHSLRELNIGFGLQLEAYKGQGASLDLTLGTTPTDPKITLAIDDIIAGLEAKVGSGNSIQDASVQDYLDVLNQLTASELATINASEPDVTKHKKLSWGVVDGGLGLRGAENVTDVNIATTNISADGQGLSLIMGVSGRGIITFDATKKEHSLGSFNAVTFHQGTVTGIGNIEISVGGGAIVKLSTDGLSQESTLADLIDKLNSELALLADGTHADAGQYSPDERKAFEDIRFTLNEAGTGIAVENTSNKTVSFHDTKASDGRTDNNFLAQDLGLIKDGDETGRVEAYSFQSGGSVGRKYIGRATKLEDWIGPNAEKGAIRITDATGTSRNVDLSNARTVGDVIDFINVMYTGGELGVKAYLNETGDGITLVEEYNGNVWPPAEDRDALITVEDAFGGSVATKLGFAGKAVKEGGQQILAGKQAKTIDVMSSDSLESIMYRLSEAGYKSAIINDGRGATPFRLSVSAQSTGQANDFVIDSDLEEIFGFTQSQRGRDSKVLYGDPNSSSSPVMLSSANNSNSSAILGITLDLKSVSNEWTTITVDTDKEKVSEEVKNMVQTYNDLTGIIKMLDGYDEETGEKGILFNDNAVKSMMDNIDDFFYQIFDPKNLGIGKKDPNGNQAVWTWQDIGVSLTAVNSNADGSGNWYSVMDLDEDKLADMIASKWDTMSQMLAGERNIAAAQDENTKPSASFNGKLAEGYDQVDSAINGNTTKGTWGAGNGIMAEDTIENGANSFTLHFQQPTTITRMNLMHYSNDTALSDFEIEFLNPDTGEWEKHRTFSGNVTDANYLSVTPPQKVSGIRLTATKTNAEDGKFRLLDFQVFEEIGLASKLNQYVNVIGDTREGFLATQNNTIQDNLTDIQTQMDRLQTKLDSKEESLWRRFTAMEVAMSKLQNQGNYFSTMMSSMGSSNK